MIIVKLSKKDFFMMERLRKELNDGADSAVLCKCDKCGGIGWAHNTVKFDKNNHALGVGCTCGGNNRKVDKVELI